MARKLYTRSLVQATVLPWAFFVLIAAFQPAAGVASNEDPAVSANASIREKLKVRFAHVQNEQFKRYSDAREKELKDLGLAIAALEEDSPRVKTIAQQKHNAGKFLKEFIRRKIRTPREEFAALHERALAFVGEGRLAEAAKLYEEIVIKNPEDDEAYLIMGHVYLMSGQYAKAEDAFRNSVHIDPRNQDEIIPFYEKRVVKDPNDDAAYADLGYACIVVGDPLKARQAFKDSLQINPSNETALKGVALLKKITA